MTTPDAIKMSIPLLKAVYIGNVRNQRSSEAGVTPAQNILMAAFSGRVRRAVRGGNYSTWNYSQMFSQFVFFSHLPVPCVD